MASYGVKSLEIWMLLPYSAAGSHFPSLLFATWILIEGLCVAFDTPHQIKLLMG